jgi:hypothetical protein
VVSLPYGHMVAILGILLRYVFVTGDVRMLHDQRFVEIFFILLFFQFFVF